jgi:uncharacterized protein YndB with AHSA1/START domain
MTNAAGRERSTEAARLIKGSREKIYRAFLDPVALATWLPPGTMTGRIHSFDGREGGGFEMSLTYQAPAHRPPGKTTEDTDTFRVRFVELEPCSRIVQAVEFETSEPALSGEMRMTITLNERGDGIEVRIVHENIPPGVRLEDNEVGTAQSLDQLAAFVEAQ